MISETQLLSSITRFIKRTGITATDFGVQSVNNPALVTRLKAGKSVTIATYNRVLRFMANGQGK